MSAPRFGAELGPAEPAETAVVYHPDTGEQLALGQAGTDTLAELQLALKARESTLKAWREQVEAELLDRLEQAKRRKATVGDYEIAVETTNRREWDADELEQTCAELIEAGVLDTGELGGLIEPQPPKVDGKLAASLLTRVTPKARTALERCFEWKRSGRPRLSVTKSVQLLPPNEETTP